MEIDNPQIGDMAEIRGLPYWLESIEVKHIESGTDISEHWIPYQIQKGEYKRQYSKSNTDAMPIRITEKILEHIGFEQIDFKCYLYTTRLYSLEYDFNGHSVNIWDKEHGLVAYAKDIKYAHELRRISELKGIYLGF